ncbi:MAG: hypothetical protein K1X92_11430 [Bacteroidia bacterium]|nr:hypothetical protein [Bacteroidia bacterium]
MNQSEYHSLLSSIPETFSRIIPEGIPAERIQSAIRENDWFTEYYINTALDGIQGWHNEKVLSDFLKSYPGFHLSGTPLNVGIIGAGNIPFVAWHDILMTVLSGNNAIVKLSRQDKVLIPCIVQKWAEVYPPIHSRIHFTEKSEKADLLIATGSDNTARQLTYHYQHTPAIIRKHRFSAGTWNGDIALLPQICRDVLLYNGLGCRSTSVLFLPDMTLLPLLESAFREYPQELLSENYRMKIQYEKARLQMLNIPFTDAESILITPQESPEPQGIGILAVADTSAYEGFYTRFEAQLQCVSGKNCFPGEAQYPGIADFADGTDTFRWLTGFNT